MSNFLQPKFFSILNRDQNFRHMSKRSLFDHKRVQVNAAVKIQKFFRGFLVRKNVGIAYIIEKGIDETFKEAELIKINVLATDFWHRLYYVSGIKDYKKRVYGKLFMLEKCASEIAAIKIQKVFRGFLVRKNFCNSLKEIEDAGFVGTHPITNSVGFANDLCAEIYEEDKSKRLMEYINYAVTNIFSKLKLESAAVRIQSSFRGFRVRKTLMLVKYIEKLFVEAMEISDLELEKKSLICKELLEEVISLGEAGGEYQTLVIMKIYKKMKEIDDALINKARDSTIDVEDDFVHVNVEFPELPDELFDLTFIQEELICPMFESSVNDETMAKGVESAEDGLEGSFYGEWNTV